MGEAILGILTWINELILGLAADDSLLTLGLENAIPGLLRFVTQVRDTIIMPVAYVVLATFFMLELYKASTRTDAMGGTATLGAEMVVKVLLKMALCKLAVDSSALILTSMYSATTYLTSQMRSVTTAHTISGGIDIAALTPYIESVGFFTGLVGLIMSFVVFLVTIAAVLLALLIVTARFIEIYVYLAIAPIPIATLANEDMSQIGKNFLKSFAAVGIQGILIFIVLSFFPIIMTTSIVSITSADDLLVALAGVMGYSILLIVAVISCGKWAKAICNAM